MTKKTTTKKEKPKWLKVTLITIGILGIIGLVFEAVAWLNEPVS